NESAEHYETVAYWYGLPAASLMQSDFLQIGDEQSEKSHHYFSPDASAPYTITSRYELGPDHLKNNEIYPATTDTGRTTTGVAEFTLALDPENLGVLLRRKLHYSFHNQRAKVFITAAEAPDDFEPAGT